MRLPVDSRQLNSALNAAGNGVRWQTRVALNAAVTEVNRTIFPESNNRFTLVLYD